jgi:hypothetical protein
LVDVGYPAGHHIVVNAASALIVVITTSHGVSVVAANTDVVRDKILRTYHIIIVRNAVVII